MVFYIAIRLTMIISEIRFIERFEIPFTVSTVTLNGLSRGKNNITINGSYAANLGLI